METLKGTTLKGKGIVVTGGGTGIGHACAAALVRDGAAVTICGRTEKTLQDSIKRLEAIIKKGGKNTEGASIQYEVVDVTDEQSVKALMQKGKEPTGTLDGVVANAGGGGGMGPYHIQDTEEYLRVLHLNVLGTMLCVKHSVPLMHEAGGGSFVGMSSVAGGQTHLWFGAYTAGKAGIEAICKNAADEYGPSNIRFNAIAPGYIATEIMDNIPKPSPIYDSYIENTPLGDVGEPEDVGNLARFLIGPESRWITGQVIAVDGGHGLRRGPDFTLAVAARLGDSAKEIMAGKLPS